MRFDYILGALAAAGSALGHMQMKSPYPLRSQFDPKNDWSNIDYDNTSPMGAGNFPCRGHHRNTPWRTAATWAAGSSATMQLAPGNQHRGGSCQLSLSYDNGATFKVIKSMIGGCPLTLSYSFTIPSAAPSGKALFGWSWFNLEGNREMYMNCAQVEITNGGSGISHLPNMWVANVGNGCSTVEGRHTVFRNPGPDVIFGSGATMGNFDGNESAESHLAKAFQDIARGEQTASAIEDHLTRVEAEIERLLGAVEKENKPNNTDAVNNHNPQNNSDARDESASNNEHSQKPSGDKQ
ncbi:hypothetical protein FQN57_005615 [Myotisia sp. PD_48]|nr:hypothetical protein FQN57_005615 [Myotisia sp. PD_48]